MTPWQFEAVEEYTPLLAELRTRVNEFERLRDSGDIDGAHAVLKRLEPLTKKIAALDAKYGVGVQKQ